MNLTIENGSFSYRQGRTIVKDLNLSVSSGELVAILGPNGAGKTTLLRCMTGFLKWDAGRTMLDGENLRSIPARRVWRRISYVPQARGAFASLTAEEMILLGRTGRLGVFSSPAAADLDRVRALMEKLHITGLSGKRCTEISGGELQMVLIARALAADPELLILDEPESNLDFKNQLIVLDTLSELAANGLCCIFNTHYPAHALTRAAKSLILKPGGEYLFGETGSVVTEENIEKAFGVKAVIGEIETPGSVLRNIVPLRVTVPGDGMTGTQDDRRSVAVIAVIASDFSAGERINALFHEYRRCLIGRMGIPCREDGLYLISATLDAPADDIRQLAHRLSILPGVSVKTTFADLEEGKSHDKPGTDRSFEPDEVPFL